MKRIILAFSICIFTITGFVAQENNSRPNFKIKSEVYFDIKPDYRKSNTTETTSAISFTITVTNNGDTPIPNLGATQRSNHLNFIVNDSINNPLSLYNGIEIIGAHLLKKGESDTYEWWIYADNVDDAYGDAFTVQWEYMNVLSEKFRVIVKTKEVKPLK